MHEIVVVGETKPGDLMERPFVAVPEARWLEIKAAAQREAGLVVQLDQEKARTAAVLADYEDYMREHQVLISKQKGHAR